MKYIKITAISLFLFLLFFVIGTVASVGQYPKSEFDRIAQRNIDFNGGAWILGHKQKIIDSDFKTIVKPAVDFLYSFATLDASAGAYVLSIPPIDRYFVFQFMEDDTDVFNYIGSRTHGKNKALNILLTPPNYKGETHGLETLELKTEMVWLLARFQLLNKEDAPNVHAIQNQVKFTPIKDWK